MHSDTNTSRRFEQQRKNWATDANGLASKCYRDYYDVSNDDLHFLEELVSDVHDIDDGYKIHQILDYGGADLIVDSGIKHDYVAQRFRPNSRQQIDLSLRTNNGVDGRYAELVKWKNAYETRGFYPSEIAFGIYDDVIDVFKEFHLIDTETILDALSENELRAEEHPTGDGTAALYITIEELERIDAILKTWDGVRFDE